MSKTSIPITPELKQVLDRQMEMFREKFGREPEANDPIFFDPNSDTPKPMPRNLSHADGTQSREVFVHHIVVGFEARTKARTRMVQTRISRLFGVTAPMRKPPIEDRMCYQLGVSAEVTDAQLAAMAEGIADGRGVTFVDFWAEDPDSGLTIEYNVGEQVKIRRMY